MRQPIALLLLSGLAGLSACDKARSVIGLPDAGVPQVPTGDPTGGAGGPTAAIRISHCTPCHGTPGVEIPNADPLVSAAPPRAIRSDTDPGVHRSHLVDGPFRRAVECASCHLLPTAAAAHPAQTQGKVSFSRLATAAWAGAPVTPVWNGSTCAGTYCHGNFKNGANATPTWAGGAGTAACGDCHGVSPTNGPGGTHPVFSAGKSCGDCHGGTYTATSVDLTLHMNGALDAGNLTCTGCHGDATRVPVASATALDALGANLVKASPPLDAGGGAAATGAHLAHVNQGDAAAPGPLSNAVACASCHAVPTSIGHSNGAADVVFGGLATTGGVTPAYDAGTRGCSSTYCHGNFAGGFGANPVSWTAAGKLGCASCHEVPPGPTSATLHHPPNTRCASCHPGYTAASVMAATHVDGAVDHTPAVGCTQCHGDLAVAGVASGDALAGPASSGTAVDAHGNAATATGARGVGAHGKHLTGTTWRAAPIACGECHAVPATGDATHADGNPAVAFGPLAGNAWSGQPPITPAWNGAGGAPNLTCASTYCHGAFKNGANATPTWATPSAVACGSCHGVSPTAGPGGTHPTFATTSTCGSCHGGTYTNTGVDPALHMNGALDVANMTCSGCHGDAARAPVASATALDALGANLVKASPPADAGGGAAATGAHLAHVNQGDTAAPGPLSNALACSSCHTVPTSTGHSNATAEVVFGGLATARGATPAPYDTATNTCASTYCHGNFAGGAGANAIGWAGTTKLGCASCHGAPPGPTSATVHHPPNPGCASCHTGYTASTVTVATHVNGVVDHAPATGCTQCHGDLTAAAVPNTDVRAAPASNAAAVDAHGNASTVTTARGVGAHGKHLTGTTWRSAPIGCGECHAVPATGDATHANGDAVVTFGALARTAWTGEPPITPAWNGAGGAPNLTCASTYCHGNFRNGLNATPTWAAPSAVTCGSCHGVSPANGPGGTHPTLAVGQDCGTCHGGTYTNTSVDPGLHLNGALDGGAESTGGVSCAGCHGAVFSAMNGGVPHASKHTLGNVLGTNDAATDTAVTWANPLSANAAAARSCVNMCHGDHPHDLSSPASPTHENNAYLDATSQATRANTATRIGVGGTGGTPNRTRTDYDATQANGGMCVSCHQNPVAAGRPTVASAAFGASAHDFVSNVVGLTTYSWNYVLHDGGLFARDCTKCHASSVEGTTPQVAAAGTVAVHYSDNLSLLAGTKNPGGTAAGFVCYNCHGSTATPAGGAQGDRSGKDIQSQIAHATTVNQSGHPANSDAVHDGVAELANAVFGNALGVAAGAGQRHASCLDCHDPHEARAGTHAVGTNVAGPPLQGAWGAQLSTSPAFWASPTSASFTKKVIAAGTDLEATLCFKCHSSFYAPALPTAPSGGYAGTDTAMEFNPNNVGNWVAPWAANETAGGFHPVLASAGGNLGAVRFTNLVTTNIAWSTTARNLMTCTDCHESDATADPNGPHGSAAGFILRGPNTRWDSTVAVNGTGAAPVCWNCHSSTYTGSRFPGHTNGRHDIACWNCHARVPHGGPRPGMLVAPAGAAAGVGATIAGWDTTAPYWGLGTSTSKLYIASYPANATTNWAQGNCGCNGAGH